MNCKRALFVILGIILCLGLTRASQSKAGDTLRILDASGGPEEMIAVPVWLVNTFDVSAVSFRIIYDVDVIEPIKIDTAGTRVAGIYDKFGNQIDRNEGWVYWFGLNFVKPNENYIPQGSGVIANLICKIKTEAQPGIPTKIELEDGGTAGHLNALSDRLGNMVLPVLDGGIVQILSTSVEHRISPIDEMPLSFSVGINPSPFSDETTIHYAIPAGGVSRREALDVSLKIYDINGRLIRNLLSEDKEPGYYMVKWDGRGDSAEELSSGIYFLKMSVGDLHTRIAKLVLVK